MSEFDADVAIVGYGPSGVVGASFWAWPVSRRSCWRRTRTCTSGLGR